MSMSELELTYSEHFDALSYLNSHFRKFSTGREMRIINPALWFPILPQHQQP